MVREVDDYAYSLACACHVPAMMNKKTKHHRRYVAEAGVGEVGIPPRLLSCPATLTMSRRLFT
jgi:hypothetical protein